MKNDEQMAKLISLGKEQENDIRRFNLNIE
jgi:hypothetical protein